MIVLQGCFTKAYICPQHGPHYHTFKRTMSRTRTKEAHVGLIFHVELD